MQFPAYCIIFEKAVKAVRAPDGGLALLVYSPAKDEFEPAIGLVQQMFFGEDTDFVPEEEFEAHVARQRAEAKSKQADAREH